MRLRRHLDAEAAPSGGGPLSFSARMTQKPSYRLIVLGMAFLSVFGAIGLGRFGYSAILPSMQKALDITSAAAGSLASWNLAGYVISAAVGGILASRFGPRLVVTLGSIIAAAGMLITGISEGMVAASAGRFLTGVGAGTVLVPSVALMSAWFDVRRRGMASGIVSSGASLALVIAGPVVPRIIESGGGDGWRMAWYFFAALTLAMGVLTFIVQRNRPYRAPHALAGQGSIWTAQPGKTLSADRTDDVVTAALAAWKPAPAVIRVQSTAGMKNVIRSRYAWHMGFVYMAFGLAYMIYFTFFQKRLTADLGLTSAAAGNLFLVVGVASIFCGFLWGAISD
ncbi:MAG: MFS transporter, partial [Thermoleophilia bacterium]|nr:MFS transporter [Thermoleophilia bacterium]